MAEGKFADCGGKIGNRSSENSRSGKGALANVKASQPRTERKSPHPNAEAALGSSPFPKRVQIGDGLAGDEEHSRKIVGDEIAHNISLERERAAMEMQRKLDQSGIQAVSIQSTGDERKNVQVMQLSVPAMHQNDERSGGPGITRKKKFSMHRVVARKARSDV